MRDEWLINELYRQRDAAKAKLVAERALADDLYDTLDRLIPDDGVLGPSVARVKARWREARK